MTTTEQALLSRGIPSSIVNNLVAKKDTLGSLSQMSESGLTALGLSLGHIAAIKDSKRPAIPVKTLEKLLEDSWRTCCVCHIAGRPIVVHHITAWNEGGNHNEDNLAVLCLDDHDKAHLQGGLSLRLSAADIRKAKTKWTARAKRVREYYVQSLLNPYHRNPRWYWIHVDNLRAKTLAIPPVQTGLSEEYLTTLKNKSFIDSEGHVNPDSMWRETLRKPQKSYLFDSSDAQLMSIYVSDLLGRFIANSAVLDITEMLDDKVALESYLSAGSLVFFRHPLEIEVDSSLVKAIVGKTDIRVTLEFDRWTSLNQTAHGIHVIHDMAQRSVVGEISSIILRGNQLRIQLSPLGISPDFILHGPSQGSWLRGGNNTDYKNRRKKAEDS